MKPRRLLTIAHSYCVALNRRLAHEMACVDADKWTVTAVAPSVFHGDLRSIETAALDGERCVLRCVPARLTRRIHVMTYGSILREVLREGWDLIHCWEEPFVCAGGQVAYWSPATTPLVFTTYQNLAKHYPPPFSAIERYALRKAAGWIAGGALVEEVLRARAGYADKPHAVIPLGVDVAHFRRDEATGVAVRRELGWHEHDPPVVGFVGRFVEQKGLRLLTKVLDQGRRPWRGLFIGGGPLADEVQRWAVAHANNVRVVGGVQHEDVWRFLNAMDVLCVPSQTTPVAREQFGRVIVEAFACGVPVLASDSGEMPRVIADAGVVIGERDERAWVAHIDRILGDPHERAQLAAAGRSRAKTHYAWSVVAQRHLEFFESLA